MCLEDLVVPESTEVFKNDGDFSKGYTTQLEGTGQVRDNLSTKLNTDSKNYSPLNKTENHKSILI